MRTLVVLLAIGFLGISLDGAAQKSKNRFKKSVYEEVDLEQMIKRYFGKAPATSNSIEGIYAVSCAITKKGTHFLTGMDRIRVVERKDNYARVAILKDWPGTNRDFIEVSMSYHVANKYPIVGEFETLAGGHGYVYKHTEPDGTKMTFSMIFNYSDLIEGVYSQMKKRKTITYKLSYLKIYPKSDELNVQR